MNSLSGGEIVTSDELGEIVDEESFDNAVVYQTSGTTGEPKRVPYGPRDLLRQGQLGADAFRLLDIDEEDNLLNLCAPEPHISGVLIDLASIELGATAYNDSFEDFDTVLERGVSDEITVVAGSPYVIRSIGQRIQASGRSAAETFPNVERVVSFGATLLPEMRTELKAQWGVDDVRNAYGSTELGCIAVAADEGEPLTPLLDHHEIELLPETDEESEPALVDIRDIREPTRGSIVVTPTDRRKYPITRYRIGDRVRVVPTADGPGIELLGREDNAISFGGALLYETQIEDALSTTYGDALTDWRAVVEQSGTETPGLTVYVVGTGLEARMDAFREELFERSTPLSEADDLGLVDYLELTVIDDVEAIEGVDERTLLTSRVLFVE